MASSGYLVELAIAPGGHRRHDLVVVGDPDDVLRVLELEYASDDPVVSELAAELVSAGMTVRVVIIDDGKPPSVIDLRPFLRVTATQTVEVDRAAVAAALPALGGVRVTPGATLKFQFDGLQAKQLDAEWLYFLEHPVKWGYRDLEGLAATPHLRKAFPRKPRR